MAKRNNTPSRSHASTILSARARIIAIYAKAEAESGRDLQGEEEAEVDALTAAIIRSKPHNAAEAAAVLAVALDELEILADVSASSTGQAIHGALRLSYPLLRAA